ncbi:MAG: hypothetical protein IJ047_07385, partial [Paludibacteraceae bacterium]|nr:hypothetical protein [Paludibacteraceae bacterium]
ACRCLLSNTANNIQTTTKRTNTPHVNEHAYIEQHLLTLSNFLGTPQTATNNPVSATFGGSLNTQKYG